MLFIGIDPGRTGALAVLTAEMGFVSVLDYDRDKCVTFLRELRSQHPSLSAHIEAVHAMPQDGSASAFRFGENFGWWQGVLESFSIPYKKVAPQTWMRHFGLTKSSPRDKPSLPLCRKAFPSAPLHLQKHNGRSDALCIAAYGVDLANTL